MATIDIRLNSKEEITHIEFTDSMGTNAHVLTRYPGGYGGVQIENEHIGIEITSKEDAQNLIKALEKATELGWWN